MTIIQWKLIVRFMFTCVNLLNRMSKTPTHEGNWTLEYDLSKELDRLEEGQ